MAKSFELQDNEAYPDIVTTFWETFSTFGGIAEGWNVFVSSLGSCY